MQMKKRSLLPTMRPAPASSCSDFPKMPGQSVEVLSMMVSQLVAAGLVAPPDEANFIQNVSKH